MSEYQVSSRFGSLAGTLYGDRSRFQANKEPIVVLWPSIFSTADVYFEFIELVSKDHLVLAMTPPGHGNSEIQNPRELDMRSCARASLDLIRQVTDRPVRWVGTSWGGLVGLEAVLLDPESMEQLVCSNTPFAFDTSRRNKIFTLAELTRLIGTTPFFSQQVAKSFFLPETMRRRDIMRAHRAVFAGGSSRQLAAAARLIFKTRCDYMDTLHRVKCPTLVIAGASDAQYPPDMQRRAAHALADGRFEILPSAHIAPVDTPSALFHLLEQYWSETSPLKQTDEVVEA